MYSNFYADIQVTPNKGKVFSLTEEQLNNLNSVEGLKEVSFALEDNAPVKYNDRLWIGKVRGVSRNFNRVTNLDDNIYSGGYFDNKSYNAIVGQGVSTYLGVELAFAENMIIYFPRKGTRSNDPNKALKRKLAYPIGKFAVQAEIDAEYILVPLEFAQELYQVNNAYSSLEISVNNISNSDYVKEELEKLLGDDFVVKTKIEQNELLYKTMRTEKWAIFFILAFVLGIACFNLVGSISMLIIEKKEDVQTLKAMGATIKTIERIFFIEGLHITFIGTIIGLIFGLAVSVSQQLFGIIKLPGQGSFIIDAYPVKVMAGDILIVIITVSLIGLLSSVYPVKKLVKRFMS